MDPDPEEHGERRQTPTGSDRRATPVVTRRWALGAAAIGAAGVLAGEKLFRGGSPDQAQSPTGVHLGPGDQVTIDCAPGTTTTSGPTVPNSTVTTGTLPATTTTQLATTTTQAATTTQPATTSSTTPQVTTTTGVPAPVTLNDSQFVYTGAWNIAQFPGAYQGDEHYSNVVGATATVQFNGSRVVLYGTKAGHHGTATVQIDNRVPATIDCRALVRAEQVVIFTSEQLPPGQHIMVVRVNGNGVVALDRLDVDGGVPPIPQASTTTSTLPPPAGGPLEALKVSGNLIVGATSGRWIPLSGVVAYAVKPYPAGDPDGQVAAVVLWHQTNRIDLARRLFGWGGNSMRLPTTLDPGTIPSIKAISDANASAGVYTWLCAFDDSAFGQFDAAGGTKRGAWLARVWNDIGRPAHVYMNLNNEPKNASQSGGVGATQWQAHSAAGVKALRDGGYGGVIVLDGDGWAHQTMPAQLRAIGDPNIALGLHAYAFEGNGVQSWTGQTRGLFDSWLADQSVCSIVGEYGPWNGDYGGNPQGRDNAAAQWCAPAGKYLTDAVAARRLAGVHSWMYLWGDGGTAPGGGFDGHGNSLLDPNTGQDDWYGVTSGPYPNFHLNPWGVLATRDMAAVAALRAA